MELSGSFIELSEPFTEHVQSPICQRMYSRQCKESTFFRNFSVADQ